MKHPPQSGLHRVGILVSSPSAVGTLGGGIHRECAAFPAGAHDDQVDAWSQGAKRLLTVTTPKRTPQYVPQREYGERS
jgi:hypothetical protein